jgi:hypothetical protein
MIYGRSSAPNAGTSTATTSNTGHQSPGFWWLSVHHSQPAGHRHPKPSLQVRNVARFNQPHTMRCRQRWRRLVDGQSAGVLREANSAAVNFGTMAVRRTCRWRDHRAVKLAELTLLAGIGRAQRSIRWPTTKNRMRSRRAKNPKESSITTPVTRPARKPKSFARKKRNRKTTERNNGRRGWRPLSLHLPSAFSVWQSSRKTFAGRSGGGLNLAKFQ